MSSLPLTRGVHHVGLTVLDLDATSAFFAEVLGWREVGGRPSYPARFFSDGAGMVTLWQLLEPHAGAGFDRARQVGLHHLALGVADEADLDALWQRALAFPGVRPEFAPEPVGGGPARHFMLYEPGGIRLEVRWPGPPADAPDGVAGAPRVG
ncbi:MAG: VOC family protein [Planctomycetes bacterium]|nr:VOC family protein [Planctomycetota bacterium]